MEGEAPWPAAEALLARAGLGGARLCPLPGGANNRSYRVEAGGRRAFLKAYFRHAADPRDRLGAEFGLGRFAWERGVRCVPRPLACDREHGLGLYEFVPGRRLEPGEVGADAVAQALAFYAELNRHRGLPAAATLAEASEACFSLAEHLRRVGRRVRALERIEPGTPVDAEALGFVRGELAPAWEAVSAAASREAHGAGIGLDDEVPPEDRCLSPSDFGFHNAILRPEGRLCFIDLEYAGWDDPSRLVCDFFCQQAVPVPMAHFTPFAEGVVAILSDPRRFRQRTELLLPVYHVKWCCILLNEFLPVGSRRRAFAAGEEDPAEKKTRQLGKARAWLAALAERRRGGGCR